jgi:hypothetical protein
MKRLGEIERGQSDASVVTLLIAHSIPRSAGSSRPTTTPPITTSASRTCYGWNSGAPKLIATLWKLTKDENDPLILFALADEWKAGFEGRGWTARS